MAAFTPDQVEQISTIVDAITSQHDRMKDGLIVLNTLITIINMVVIVLHIYRHKLLWPEEEQHEL